MAEDKKEKWLSYMAFTTVIVAVCATFSTFKGGGYSTRSLMNQSKASDQWAFFQSKSLKSYIFEMQRDNLQLTRETLPKNTDVTILKVYDNKIESYNAKLKQYDAEKTAIMSQAKGFEALSNESKKHSEAFGFAVIFLQISILLSSISALAKKHYIYYLSLAIALPGILYFLDGFFLFLH